MSMSCQFSLASSRFIRTEISSVGRAHNLAGWVADEVSFSALRCDEDDLLPRWRVVETRTFQCVCRGRHGVHESVLGAILKGESSMRK